MASSLTIDIDSGFYFLEIWHEDDSLLEVAGPESLSNATTTSKILQRMTMSRTSFTIYIDSRFCVLENDILLVDPNIEAKENCDEAILDGVEVKAVLDGVRVWTSYITDLLKVAHANMHHSAILVLPSNVTCCQRESLKVACVKAGLQIFATEDWEDVCTDDSKPSLQILSIQEVVILRSLPIYPRTTSKVSNIQVKAILGDAQVWTGTMAHLLEVVHAHVQQQKPLSTALVIPSSFTCIQRECVKVACAKARLQIFSAYMCTDSYNDNYNAGLQILLAHIVEDWEVNDLPGAVEEEEWLHRGGYSWQGMDIGDLPYVLSQGKDKEVWHEIQECVWDSVDETEKACCDRQLSSITGKPVFSRVFVLGSSNRGAYVSIPKSYNPHHESPSAQLKTQPTLLATAINATLRIRTSFGDEDEDKHISFGTGFLVSPTVCLTAKHCISKPNVHDIKAHGGLNVLMQHFESDAAVEGGVAQSTIRNYFESKDGHGLFRHGSDVDSFFTNVHFTTFLLPCSPTFILMDQVAIVSYPSIDKFLKNAKEELIKESTNDSTIWEQYLPVVKSLYDNSIKEYAKAVGMRTEKEKATNSVVKATLKKVKQTLYTELVNTFGSFHTGTMVCSVGTVLHTNKVCIGTSCSTLAGSSGAAVCPISRPTNYIGIHRGGSKGFDLNIATSTDNPDAVNLYMSCVLPTLPHPKDSYWKSRDVDGFYHWLGLHASEIPNSSPWRTVAKEAGPTVSKKRLKRQTR